MPNLPSIEEMCSNKTELLPNKIKLFENITNRKEDDKKMLSHKRKKKLAITSNTMCVNGGK